MNDIEIKYIAIKVGDTELKLSVDELRRLRDTIDSLIKNDTVIFPKWVEPYPGWESPFRYTITSGDSTSTFTGDMK